MTSVITTAVSPFSYNLATLQELLTTNVVHNPRMEDSIDLRNNEAAVRPYPSHDERSQQQTRQEYHSQHYGERVAAPTSSESHNGTTGAPAQMQRHQQKPKQYTDHAWKSYSFEEFKSPAGESDACLYSDTTTSSASSYPPSSSTIREDHDLMFPEKLYLMLKECSECHAMSHIVSWRQHGRAFRVHKPREFVRAILPKYFRQSKMTSFQRQLNLYGFKRLTAGDDKGSYYHELFLRGRLRLSQYIRRTRIKGIGTKQKASPQLEPNFASMVPCKENDSKFATPEYVPSPSKQNYYLGGGGSNIEEHQSSFSVNMPPPARDQHLVLHPTKAPQQSFYIQQQDGRSSRGSVMRTLDVDVTASSTHHPQHIHERATAHKSPLTVSCFPEQMGELRRSFLGSNDSPRDLPMRDMRTPNQFSNTTNQAKGMWYNFPSSGQRVVNEDMQLFSSAQAGEVGDDFVW